MACALAGAGQPSQNRSASRKPSRPLPRKSTGCTTTSTSSSSPLRLSCSCCCVYVMWRFSEKRNPTPSRTTHNTTVEVLWTVIPVFILVAIAIPSFKLLFDQYTYPPPDLTIKAVGHTWNWTHEYPDQGIGVDSVMLQDGEREDAIKAGMPADQVPRNLAVDNEILVPVNKVVHVLVTSTDVIHSWTIPSFGSKVDAVPGRITATWFKATDGRSILRPVLGTVRQRPCLHADRGARGKGTGVCRLGRGAEGA